MARSATRKLLSLSHKSTQPCACRVWAARCNSKRRWTCLANFFFDFFLLFFKRRAQTAFCRNRLPWAGRRRFFTILSSKFDFPQPSILSWTAANFGQNFRTAPKKFSDVLKLTQGTVSDACCDRQRSSARGVSVGKRRADPWIDLSFSRLNEMRLNPATD